MGVFVGVESFSAAALMRRMLSQFLAVTLEKENAKLQEQLSGYEKELHTVTQELSRMQEVSSASTLLLTTLLRPVIRSQ